MGGTKYPVGTPRKRNGCKRCSRGLGLMTVRWRNDLFCCQPCRRLYKIRWRRDWQQRWFARFHATGS
jgi:hypothetical protein